MKSCASIQITTSSSTRSSVRCVRPPICAVSRSKIYELAFREESPKTRRFMCAQAPLVANDFSSLKVAMPHARHYGAWLEFGVFSGKTIRIMAAYREAHHPPNSGGIYGFDSFEGLPEDWDNSGVDLVRTSRGHDGPVQGRFVFDYVYPRRARIARGGSRQKLRS